MPAGGDRIATLPPQMHALRRHGRRSAWIALLAVLAMALVPTLARALAHGQGTGTQWVEVCTAQGTGLVAVAGHGTAAPEDGGSSLLPQLEHCPLCVPAHAGPGPSAPAFDLPPPVGMSDTPSWLGLRPQALDGWRSAQPRGPPLRR
jgi:hypothetical protein